jgi:hypothetical protein
VKQDPTPTPGVPSTAPVDVTVGTVADPAGDGRREPIPPPAGAPEAEATAPEETATDPEPEEAARPQEEEEPVIDCEPVEVRCG